MTDQTRTQFHHISGQMSSESQVETSPRSLSIPLWIFAVNQFRHPTVVLVRRGNRYRLAGNCHFSIDIPRAPLQIMHDIRCTGGLVIVACQMKSGLYPLYRVRFRR
jgi:hypothetical protein